MKVIKGGLLILIIVLGIFLLDNKSVVKAVPIDTGSCSPDCCGESGSAWYVYYDDYYGRQCALGSYSCSGLATSCTCTGYPCVETHYTTKTACENGSGGSNSAICCVDCPCTPITSCSCGSLATSNQGYGSNSVSCSDGCGGTASSTCYCYACTPPACPSNTYSTNQENGHITRDCRNDCNIKSERTCYCPAADCADLDSNVTWSNTQPSGDHRTYTGPVPIPNYPTGCPATQDKTCYIAYSTNRPPENTLVEIVPKEQVLASTTPLLPNNLLMKFIRKIKAANFTDTILGFTSESHSGRGLDVDNGGGVNNPVGLTATYTDTDGQQDIQAIYIWWNPSSTKNFNTPNRIASSTARTDSNQNWGFLIARDNYSGAFNSVYAPRTYGSDRIWVREGSINEDITIYGSSPQDMVELSNISVNGSGNDISLQLTMKFLNEPGDDLVDTSQYNIWAMANDYVGFTEFETTPGNIKDSGDEFWQDSGENWNLDMVTPNTCNIASISDTHVGKITVAINTEDNDNISYVRLDACKSGIGNIDKLSTIYNSSYTLTDCDSFNSTGIDITSENSLLGINGHSPSNPYSNNIVVDLNNNAEGSITFYLTVMDNAGNFDQVFDIYRLEQWAMVNNGFVYGKGGVTSSSRLVQADSWGSHPLLTSLAPDMNEENADITNQVLMGGTPSLTSRLRALERYKENKSFKVAKYPGILMTTPYSELISAYKQKAVDNNTFEYHEIGNTLSGSLTGLCTDLSKDYCILEKDGDLNIAKNFNCDGKGLIIAKGDITITPDLTSGDSIDEACIILSGGNINIKPGKDLGITSNPVPAPEYDEVHGYLIANGEIVIEKHSTPPIDIDSSFNQPGLYVKGGLSAFTPNLSGPAAVYNEREIYFGHMGIYPILVVDSNAKYGFLSTGVFGSQIDIFKLEIGFKPF